MRYKVHVVKDNFFPSFNMSFTTLLAYAIAQEIQTSIGRFCIKAGALTAQPSSYARFQ